MRLKCNELLKICRKKKHETKPGEILDQVISQSSSSANKCLLYKLANYKRGKRSRAQTKPLDQCDVNTRELMLVDRVRLIANQERSNKTFN